jgi:hypothetical protein
MRRNLLAVFLLVMFVLGCSDDDGSPTGQTMNLSGVWAFTDSLLNWGGRTPQCTSGRGVLTLTQAGTSLTGSLTDETGCLTDSTNLGSRAGQIVAGTVSANQVSFEVAFCQYVATTSGGDPPARMTGTETCLLHLGGTDSVFYGGDWQASR